MKSFAVLAATFAGAAMAQELPMPSGDCANLCINNMARIAETQLQCGSDDISCFCTRSNWAFGIRDCSRQACDAAQSADAVQWAYARCAGVAATASNTPDAIPILTSAVASATASGNGNNNGGSSSNSNGADVTSTVAVIASSAASAASSATGAAGSAASSVRSSMTSMVSSAASEAASLTSSIMSDANSALSSLSSEASEIMASASSAISSATESAAESATGTNAEGSPSATRTEGAAPKVTGMSFAAGAGIAAWLLL